MLDKEAVIRNKQQTIKKLSILMMIADRDIHDDEYKRVIEIIDDHSLYEMKDQEISDLDDPNKAELILRKRGYGEPGEVLYRFEVPEPVTPIEETLKSDTGKSLIEYVIDYVVGREGE